MAAKGPSIEFKVHPDEGSVQIRISRAQNGYVVKAGKKPYLCASEAEVKKAVEDITDGYFHWINQ